jgi:hypothetical protein
MGAACVKALVRFGAGAIREGRPYRVNKLCQTRSFRLIEDAAITGGLWGWGPIPLGTPLQPKGHSVK